MTQGRFRDFLLRVLGTKSNGGGSSPLKSHSADPPIAVDVAQVVRCMVRFNPDPKRYATLAAMRDATELFGFVPAGLVTQKTKSVADGVVATLESLSTAGTKACLGVDAFLAQLAERLPPEGGAHARIDTAIELARGAAVPGGAARVFLDTPLASKPLGFYTWGEDLRRVFQRDRYLQQVLPEDEADVLREAIHDDAGLLAAYGHHLRRVARLTNGFSRPSLLTHYKLFAGDRRKPTAVGRGQPAIVPPSAAPENDFESIADFFAAVRTGMCSLSPDVRSGFYIHQLHALEPLLRPDASPEASMRQVDADYVAALERFAGASLFMARETHVKQLDVAAPVMSPVRVQTSWVRPDIKIEPLPSYYARLADGFRFLRTVVEEGWGAEALAAPRRRELGPADSTVAESIEEAIGLCETAARVSRRELEGAADHPEVIAGRARLFALWSDADAMGDVRGMVPLGETPQGAVRVLVFAGWEVHTLLVKLVSVPQRLPKGAALGGVGYPLPLPLIREAVVDRSALLDRGETRKRCDEALAGNAPVR